MRLLVVDEEIIAGGVETLRRQLLPELARLAEAIVWVLPAHAAGNFRAMETGGLRIETLESRRGTLPRMGEALARRGLFGNARKLRDARLRHLARKYRCDVCLTTCVFSQPPPEIGLPVAGFVSDLNPSIPPHIRANIDRWVENSAAIFGVSEFTASELLKSHPRRVARIRAIPLAPPNSDSRIAPSASAARTFYYPSAANPHKGHLALLEAALSMARRGVDLRLVFSGAGFSQSNPTLREMQSFLARHESELGGRVTIAGDASPAEIDKYFADAGCVVLPSEYEGFGLPLAEALRHGKPVICADIPPFREQIRRHGCEDMAAFFPPRDAGALAEAMAHRLLHPIDMAKIDLAARLQRWTWKDAAQACMDALEKIRAPAPMRHDTGLAAKIHWHLNAWMLPRLGIAQRLGLAVTVHDAFGAPGDALLTAIVCRHLKEHYPRLRINCITPHPDLLRHDPNISTLNEPETYLCLRHWYLEVTDQKRADFNVLQASFRTLGMSNYTYKARVYLTEPEIAEAAARLGATAKPVLTFNIRSREPVKTWPAERWRELLARLGETYELVHLGDASEPEMPGVRRFAGILSMRESMAMLSRATLHVGPESFLAHAANGLGVRSAVILGGSRTPANAGYAENIDLFVPMPCGPCYIHESRGEKCAYGIECMNRISVSDVLDAVSRLRHAS